MNKLFISLTLTSFLASSACFAQLGEAPMPKAKPRAVEASGPTLEETEKWIVEKLKQDRYPPKTGTNSDGSKWSTYYYREIAFKDCEMIDIGRREQYLNDVLKNKNRTGISIVPLSEIDEAGIKIGQVNYDRIVSQIQFRSIGDRPVFLVNYYESNFTKQTDEEALKNTRIIGANPGGDGRNIQTHNHAAIEVSSLELAERISSALKHAIKLCQVKAVQEKQKATQEKAEKAKSQPREIF